MSEQDAEGRVREWLNKSGAALEHRTAATFQAVLGRGAVHHGRRYLSAEQDKLREVDVVARIGSTEAIAGEVTLTAAVECKSSKLHPWVIYDSDIGTSEDVPFAPTLISDWRGFDRRTTPAAQSRYENSLLNPRIKCGYQLSDTAGENPNKPTRNIAWDAVRQLMDAAQAVQEDHQGAGYDWFTVVLPVLVVSAPIFVVTLSPTGDFVITRVARKPVIFETIEGRGLVPSITPRGIWVVHEDDLSLFANDFVFTGQTMDLE